MGSRALLLVLKAHLLKVVSASLLARRSRLLDLRFGISSANPGDELLRQRHRREASLPNERQVVELARLFDLGQRYRRLEATCEFQIDHRRLGILWIVARLRFHRSHPDHARNAATVIDEDY